MTSTLPLPPSIHLLDGCRSYQRQVVNFTSQTNIKSVDKHLELSARDKMQPPQSRLPSCITTNEYSHNMASWYPLPEADSTGECRLGLTFAMREARSRRHDSQPRTPFIFVPCQLDISPCEGVSSQSGSRSTDRTWLECAAVPGDFVRSILSGPLPRWHGRSVRDALGPAHFDDGNSWVFSRCLMADFSGMGSDQAERLSREGRLGCWASVTLTRQDSGGWDLGFLIHRFVVCGDQ